MLLTGESRVLVETSGAAMADGELSVARRTLPYLVLLVLGLWCAFYPMLLSGFRLMEVNTGDTRFLNFILEHSYRWLQGWLTLHPISLWDQPFFFPARNVAAYSEMFVGSAPIYWLLRLLRFAPDTAFQLWMVAVLVLDFVSMVLFLRNCPGFGRVPSAIGAFLFAFGSPRLAQLGHQQLLPQFYTVFAAYGLFRFFEPRKMSARQGISVFFVCFAAQLWAGFYLGWFLFFGLLVGAIWAVSLRRYRDRLMHDLRRYRTTVAVAACSFLVLIAPMAYHYLKVLREVGGRPFANIALMIPPPQSWFYMGGESWLYSWQPRVEGFRSIVYEHEQRLGIGWLTLVLAVLGFFRFQKERGGWARLAGFAAITILLLMTLYPGGFTPWKYLFQIIPGATAIRAVSRIGLLMLVPLSIGLAFLVEKRKSIVAAVVIGGICVLEQAQSVYSYDKLQVREHVAAVAAQIQRSCSAFFYSPSYAPEAAQTPPEYELHVDAMWAALDTGIPTINGYSGNVPNGWWDLWENKTFDSAGEARIRHSVERWTATHGIDPARVCSIRSP